MLGGEKLSLSEVIAQLEQDDRLEFESTSDRLGNKVTAIVVCVKDGDLVFYINDSRVVSVYVQDSISLDRVWRLVDKRISFNEAMEALKNGQDVYCDYKGERLFYRAASMYPFSTVTAGGGRYLLVGAMLEGNWYLGGLY